MKKYRIREGSIAWKVWTAYIWFKEIGWMFMVLLLELVLIVSLTFSGMSDRAEARTVHVSHVSAEKPVIETVQIIEQKLYDVPLDADLQQHIINTSEMYGVDPAIIMAMIDTESSFRADAVGDDGRSYGLMQIQVKFHQERMQRLGVSDMLNPYENVLVGIDYLAEQIARGNGIEWALMGYNGGASYANEMSANGLISDYAANVLSKAGEIEML